MLEADGGAGGALAVIVGGVVAGAAAEVTVFSRNQLSRSVFSATSCNSEGHLFTSFKISSKSALSLSSITNRSFGCPLLTGAGAYEDTRAVDNRKNSREGTATGLKKACGFQSSPLPPLLLH